MLAWSSSMLEVEAYPAGIQSNLCSGGVLDARGDNDISSCSHHTHCISTTRATGSTRCCAVCAALSSSAKVQVNMS